MDMNDIVTAISTVGFPIVMCGLMFWYLNQEKETHKQEVASLTSVISENKEVLVSLKQLLEDKLG